MFNGTDPNGTWRLYAVDDQIGRQGNILGWSLDITTTDPPAPTPTPTTMPEPTAGPETDVARPASPRRGQVTGPPAYAAGADVIATLSETVSPGTLTKASVHLQRGSPP